jgi:hypothetical protein
LLIGLNFLVTEPIKSNFFPEFFISFKGLSLLLKKNRAGTKGGFLEEGSAAARGDMVKDY